jgi:hypothetical protein
MKLIHMISRWVRGYKTYNQLNCLNLVLSRPSGAARPKRLSCRFVEPSSRVQIPFFYGAEVGIPKNNEI